MSKIHTIAMWSGPRNLSTAMMRAWENRSDTQVWDEPLYAYYLASTGQPDPMAAEIIAAGPSERDAVIKKLCTPPQSGLQYHKHITTHILPGDSLNWLAEGEGTQHIFLIREPVRVVASFNQVIPSEDDELYSRLGFQQQERLFDAVVELTGSVPLVIDSTRFLTAPEAQLRRLCEKVGITFESAMLAWPAGARDSDGIWSSHWYASVEKSTQFGAPPTSLPELTSAQRQVADRCEESYERLLSVAL